jgi:hypothetical protein
MPHPLHANQPAASLLYGLPLLSCAALPAAWACMPYLLHSSYRYLNNPTDDIVLFKGDEYLWTANPHLELFFKSYLQQQLVMEWCKAMRPDLVEGAASG